jgi:hypothetical protein
MYKQIRSSTNTIVVFDNRWANTQTFALSDEVCEFDLFYFLEEIQNLEIYWEDVATHRSRYLLRTHGPFTLRDITRKDYVQLRHDELSNFIESTLADPKFANLHSGNFPKKFVDECKELVLSFLNEDTEILFLNRPFSTYKDECWWRYGYWAELIFRSKTKKTGVLITFGED